MYLCMYVRTNVCVHKCDPFRSSCYLRSSLAPFTLSLAGLPAANSKDNCLELQVPSLFPEDNRNGFETSPFPFTSTQPAVSRFFFPCSTFQLSDPDTISGFIFYVSPLYCYIIFQKRMNMGPTLLVGP